MILYSTVFKIHLALFNTCTEQQKQVPSYGTLPISGPLTKALTNVCAKTEV